MTKLEHALAWARAGWQVFPCKPGVKEPATINGVKDATQDEAQILEWWMQNPDFNIGGTRGIIVDCDIKGSRSGELEFQAWLDRQGLDGLTIIDEARRHRTPGGGLHVIFDAAEALGQPDLIKGLVNLRTAGHGYVCLPGSTIDEYDGRGYWVENDVAPTLAPAPLVLHCRPRERALLETAAELDHPIDVSRALTYLSYAAVAVQGMGGDNHTYQIAQDVMDMGVSPRTALELMIQHWNPRCIPPWSIDELATKVSNAANYRQNDLGATKMGASKPSASFEALKQRAAAGKAPPKLEGQGLVRPSLFRTAQELQDMPPTEYLVDLILPERSILMVYGAAKAGKSLLALDLAMHLALGRRSWAGLEIREGTGGVVYCTGEGNTFLGSRYRAWCHFNKVETPPPPERFLWAEIVPKLGHPLEGNALELVRGIVARRPRLLILDTLEMATLDIIDAVEAVAFMENLRTVVEEAGCAVIIVHHENREGDNRGSRVYRHQVDGAVRLELVNGQHDPRRTLSSDVHRAGRGLGDIPRGFNITEVEYAPGRTDACFAYDPAVEVAVEEQREAERQQTFKEKAVQELWVPRIVAILTEKGGLWVGADGKRDLLNDAALRIAAETGTEAPSIGDSKTDGHPLYDFNRKWAHPKKGDKRLLPFIIKRNASNYPDHIGAIVMKESEK